MSGGDAHESTRWAKRRGYCPSLQQRWHTSFSLYRQTCTEARLPPMCGMVLNEGEIQLLVNKIDRKNLRRNAAERSNRVCYICQERIPESEPVTMDHITPKSDGGRDEESNVGCACKRCNDDKSNVDLKDYITQMKQRPEAYVYMTARKIANLEAFATNFYTLKEEEEVGL